MHYKKTILGRGGKKMAQGGRGVIVYKNITGTGPFHTRKTSQEPSF